MLKKGKVKKRDVGFMKWIAIAGSWRSINKKIEQDVRRVVRSIALRRDGIVSGGALGVDYFALDEAMKFDPGCENIKIFLPSSLKVFTKHFLKRAFEGVISEKQAKDLIKQLGKLKKINSSALIENKKNKLVNKKAYYQRIVQIVNAADKLIAFHVNKSQGTQYTIGKAREKDILVKRFIYTL